MAITESGIYGATLKKALANTAAIDLLTTSSVKTLMVTDTYTPNFNTHTLAADVTNEVSGTGYTAGGAAASALALDVSTPATGQLRYDKNDESWAGSTISNAMAAIVYNHTAVDGLIYLADFVTAASTTAGTFSITWATNGLFYIDHAG